MPLHGIGLPVEYFRSTKIYTQTECVYVPCDAITLNFLLVKIDMEACDLKGNVYQHGVTYNDINGAYLCKIPRTSQIQDVHVLVDVLAIEPPKHEYPAISQNRHMISSRR